MSPKTFLKARRPERFSDSVVIEERPLDRSLLEYHLETLTSRSQEADFERFARLLAEREVCPNLLPHTGPTGGGDSKVDSETYPVAYNLALAWFVGEARQAASERWAFAFSAKKDWRAKVQADVAKIAATGRGYVKAFFVSNQFVPDKTRAEVEDSLRTTHGLDVRILDRSWVLERVFAGRHEQLAIDELKLQVSTRTQLRKGPFDVRREQELEVVDANVERLAREGLLNPPLIDSMLQSALLARGLERPRTEVEGRFARARTAAAQYGTRHQRIVIAYQEAFGTFWWYEDYASFPEKIQEFERQVDGSDNVYHLELTTTLWLALFIAVHGRRLDRSAARLDERADKLLKDLDAATKLENRPSAALQAEALSLSIRLHRSRPDRVDDLLVALRGVVDRSTGLLGFPLTTLAEAITDMSSVFGDRAAFNELHDAIVAAVSTRQGELTGARLLLRRGAQHLDADKPYEAIRSIGKVLARLYKDESRDELICALYLLGAAYEDVGLLWAARGSLLHAASVATGEFWRTETITSAQAACYDRLRWLELRLGRLPHALAWHEVTQTAKGALAQKGADPNRLGRGDREFDGTLGILILRTDYWELKWLTQLPDVLDDLALPWAALTLRFALGHDDDVKKDLTLEGDVPPDLDDLFTKLAGQPVAADLPSVATLYCGRTALLASHVLGCPIKAETETASPCVELTESILAAFESMLATGMLSRSIIPHVPSLTIRVRRVDLGTDPFTFDSKDVDGHPHFEVRAADWSAHKLSVEQQRDLRDRLMELLAPMLARAFFVDDAEQALVALIRDERAIERAIYFTGSFVTISNVLGDRPKHTLDQWLAGEHREFPLRRSKPWNADAAKPPEKPAPKPTPGVGDPPQDLQWREAKHTEIQTVSLIQSSLWDDADWFATMFITAEGDRDLPFLAPAFRKGASAQKIFAQWRRDLGETDEREMLRVSVVRGVSAANPYAYRVLFGSNPDEVFGKGASKFVVTVSRVNYMDPPSPENLDRFLKSYVRHGAYFLLPAVSSGDIKDVKISLELAVRKRVLHVVDAWRVGQNDPETAAIVADDSPIIPSGREQDAPILAVLKKRRSR